jgi:hypothetical protein
MALAEVVLASVQDRSMAQELVLVQVVMAV